LTSDEMDRLIRRYFDGCNAADTAKIESCFVPDAVHYFPPGMYNGPFRGAATIAKRWAEAVSTFGSVWTIDQVITDPPSSRAVIEWSHFKTFQNLLLRGDEWYLFEPGEGLIKEIRAYYASPQSSSLQRNELEGFDYTTRGYPEESPMLRSR